jgi:serine/threonine-protein kinase
VRSADRAALDRLLATAGFPKDGLDGALDATIRPGNARPVERPAGRTNTTITGPFLPSITLSESVDGGSAPVPTTADLLVTTLLGEGGMGVVHLATQRSLDRSVALKRPLGTSSEVLVEEARTMAAVEHPNVVPVHALGRDASDRPVLVMKRVQGASFRELLRDDAHSAWPPLIARWGDRERASLGILGEVADALGLAHARKIIHRDVKPENVMVGEFGEVYLLDWGIARRLDAPPTETGAIVGTPGYLAPEMVLSPDRVDARTDVYLLGATLHEILTRTLRHKGSSLYETLGLALASEPIVYGPEVPEDLATLANAATSLEPEDRPASAAAFRAALRDHERHREALGLVLDARATLSLLTDRTIPLGDERALPILMQAGAALAAAIRSYPDGASVQAAHDEHLHLWIERELALESPAAARAHLAQLRTEDAALAARIDALDEKLSRDRAQHAALAAARADADVSRGLRLRTIAMLVAFAPVALVTIVLATTGASGGAELSPSGMLATDATVLVLLVLGMVLGRRVLFANRGNRALTLGGVAGWLGIAGSNALGIALGRPANEVLAHTHVVIATILAVVAAHLHPLYLIGTATSIVFAILLVHFPEHTSLISPAGMVAGIAAVVAGTMGQARTGART